MLKQPNSFQDCRDIVVMILSVVLLLSLWFVVETHSCDRRRKRGINDFCQAADTLQSRARRGSLFACPSSDAATSFAACMARQGPSYTAVSQQIAAILDRQGLRLRIESAVQDALGHAADVGHAFHAVTRIPAIAPLIPNLELAPMPASSPLGACLSILPL